MIEFTFYFVFCIGVVVLVLLFILFVIGVIAVATETDENLIKEYKKKELKK